MSETNETRRRLRRQVTDEPDALSRGDVLRVLDHLDRVDPMRCDPVPCKLVGIGDRFHDHPFLGTAILGPAIVCEACRMPPAPTPAVVAASDQMNAALRPFPMPRVVRDRFYCACGLSHKRGPVQPGGSVYRCLGCGETSDVPPECRWAEGEREDDPVTT